MKNRFNIVFIVIDALRAKNLECYGYSRHLSPNIDYIAETGLLFEKAYSCTTATDSSLPTLFSGKYPLSHGVISHGKDVGENSFNYFNESGTKLLPELLKQKGYKTMAIDWLSRWHSRGYDYYSGPSKNISQKFLSRFLFRGPLDKYLGILSRHYIHFKKSLIIDNASKITSQAINLINSTLEENFLLFIHYWDSHTPYAPPPKYFHARNKIVNFVNPTFLNPFKLNEIFHCSRFLHFPRYYEPPKEIQQEYVHRYNCSIKYIDNEIGKLINFLETAHLTENTLIIITSDHGESLLEHGIYFDHYGLYDNIIHVPLIMKHAGFPKGKRIKELVQHIDVVPTIMDMLSEKTENLNMDGKSLLPLIFGQKGLHREEVYAIEELVQRRAAIRTNNYKYIFAPTNTKVLCKYGYNNREHEEYKEELYDLRRDPHELRNISHKSPAVKNMLKEKLVKWLESFDYYKKFVSESKDKVLDTKKEILEKLRELGYV